MTVSVVSDSEGRYHFPAGRLEPGHYAISIRAAGYMLESGNSVTIGEQKNASADLRLFRQRRPKQAALSITPAKGCNYLACM